MSMLAFAVMAVGAPQDSKVPEISAGELVRLAVSNEVAAAVGPKALHLFRSRRQTPKGSQTRLYVETDEALAVMMIAIDDQPLTLEQQQAESGRLGWLVGNPDQLRKKHAREKEDEERTMRILKALPEAFHYEYDGTEIGTAGTGVAGEPVARIKFLPNPSYAPPTRVEQVLAGFQGEMFVDTRLRRIVKVEGTLYRDVNFGWGILGRLDKGGHFLVRQGDLILGNGDWGITEMDVNISGKILLVKSLSMTSDEVLSDFRIAGKNLTFAQGFKMLKAEHERLANSPHTEAMTEAHKNDHQGPSQHR